MFGSQAKYERFQAVNHPAASSNQNVTINIPREKPEEWPPCFLHKLKSRALLLPPASQHVTDTS